MLSPIAAFLTSVLIVFGQASNPDIPARDLTAANANTVKQVKAAGKLIVEVGGNWKTVRLAGVDVPEKGSAHAAESEVFLGNLLLGESVYLFQDEATELFHVYRAPDGLWVNLELVRQGYGRSKPSDFAHKDVFTHYESVARNVEKGLWAFQQSQPPPQKERAPTSRQPKVEKKAQAVTVYVTKTGKKYHRSSCSYLRKSKIPMDLEDAKRGYGPCSRCGPPT